MSEASYRVKISLFDSRKCHLGEGAFWHPTRRQFFWFDITEKKLLSVVDEKKLEWKFDERVSAAGWLDEDRLLVASENRLFQFNFNTSRMTTVCPLEASMTQNRSNDGKADPWGGFWISTMAKNAQKNAGSIYRYFNGQIRKIHGGLSIPNSICFSPDKSWVYFSDTIKHVIFRQKLNFADGWPKKEAEVFADFSLKGLHPDGADIDLQGQIWCAFWGTSEVACISKDGEIVQRCEVPASQPSCPAFGGRDYKTIFLTSAREGLLVPQEADGQTFSILTGAQGAPQPNVNL